MSYYKTCHEPQAHWCIVTLGGATAVTRITDREAAIDLADAMNEARERRLRREAEKQQQSEHHHDQHHGSGQG